MKFDKLFSKFAQLKGVDIDVYRFHYEGKRLHGESTPQMFEMEDGDSIDAFVHAVGGNVDVWWLQRIISVCYK